MGRELMLDFPDAEIDRIAATAHDAIAGAIIALHRHCANGRSASRRLANLRTARKHTPNRQLGHRRRPLVLLYTFRIYVYCARLTNGAFERPKLSYRSSR